MLATDREAGPATGSVLLAALSRRDAHAASNGWNPRAPLEVEFRGTDPTGQQGEPRSGFSARTAISRRDLGITFGLAVDGTKIVIADKVDIVLDVEAYLYA